MIVENTFSRRDFLKGTAAAALAVSASALLSACGADAPLTATANGLNGTAELQGVKMTVRGLYYAQEADGSLYLMPEVLVRNESTMDIPLYPEQGSFLLRINGSTNLILNQETMRLISEYKEDGVRSALRSLTLSKGGRQEMGSLCGRIPKDGPTFEYVQVFFYPNPKDTRTYLCCRIEAKQAETIKKEIENG